MNAYAALKGLHIGALVIWCAGLIVIPSLYRQRAVTREGEPVHDLHRFTRGVFVNITSPAAFVAVGSGTALLFVGDVFTAWMFIKLAAVGALVGLHMRAGLVIITIFNRNQRYAAWRQVGATLSVLAVIAAILGLVLGKPEIAMALPVWLTEPGGLHSLAETIRPTP